jgi:hypothetical protein
MSKVVAVKRIRGGWTVCFETQGNCEWATYRDPRGPSLLKPPYRVGQIVNLEQEG